LNPFQDGIGNKGSPTRMACYQLVLGENMVFPDAMLVFDYLYICIDPCILAKLLYVFIKLLIGYGRLDRLYPYFSSISFKLGCSGMVIFSSVFWVWICSIPLPTHLLEIRTPSPNLNPV